MSVTVQSPLTAATANGSTTAFSFNFYIAASTDLVVQVDAVTKTLNVDYTVSGAGAGSGGTVTFTAAPANGATVTLYRNTLLERQDDFQTGGDLSADVLDSQFDRLWLALQEIFSGGKGAPTAVRVPPGEVINALPAAASRANRLIGFDALGQVIATLPTAGDATALTIDLANSASAIKGSALVGFSPTLNYATSTLGFSMASQRRWNPMDYPWLAKFDGVTDDGPAISACAAALEALGGGVVAMPGRTAKIATSIRARNLVTFEGVGDATQLLVTTDIEVFNSDTTTVNSNISTAVFRNFYIKKTVATATTKYDIHLQNPLLCRLERVHIQSGHGDTAYSATNVGGIWLDKPDTSTQGSYCNAVVDCWMQNNSLYFRNITDSTIRGGWVWGHVREFAIRVRGGGNIDITGVNGIITSQYKGGIWIDGTAVNQLRIVDNEWDGNPLLQRGDGIYCPQSATQITVQGNTIWACGKNGINVTDPVGWSITGNNFWKNNDNDGGFDDIRITGATFQPNGNVIVGNTHTMDVARVNKGYAIREVNAGFNPIGNTYNSNGINGASNYLSPAALVLVSAEYDGSLGGGVRMRPNSLDLGEGALGDPGLLLATNTANVNAGGTLDLTVNTATYLGNPGGFAGILTVTSTRLNAPTQSRRTVYAVVGYGATATFTSLATQDGSGGGSAFTVTMSSAGVIRFTDTSGQQVGVRMAFSGSKSVA